jgi:hypothetical protein
MLVNAHVIKGKHLTVFCGLIILIYTQPNHLSVEEKEHLV